MAKEAETKREKKQDGFYFSHKSLYIFLPFNNKEHLGNSLCRNYYY